jgi:hypothetical protein
MNLLIHCIGGRRNGASLDTKKRPLDQLVYVISCNVVSTEDKVLFNDNFCSFTDDCG